MNTTIDVKHHISDNNQQISRKDKFWRRGMGFTLVELMVTIAVMAIVAMIAVPSFSNMLEKQKLNAATHELISNLNSARSQAIILRKSTTLTLIPINDSTDYENSDVHFYWRMRPNITITPSAISSIDFNENGMLKNATLDTQIVLCNSLSNTTKSFKVMLTGIVYVTPEGDGVCE